MATHKPILEWRLNTELPALVAASDRHHDVYIIRQTRTRWQLDHPWSVTSTLENAAPELCETLWDAITAAERMEREGTRFPQEVK